MSPRIVVVGAVLAYVAVVLWGAGGVRGSDQYWYVADVASILDGHWDSHHNFSRLVLTTHPSLSGGPFVHHDITLYVVLPLAMLFGPYFGFVATNILAMIATAALTGQLAQSLSKTPNIGPTVFVLFLLSPLSFWLAMQPLAESTIAVGVAVCAWGFVRRDGTLFPFAAFAIGAAFLYLSRSSFLPVLVAAPFLVLFDALLLKKGVPSGANKSLGPFVIALMGSVLVVGLAFVLRKTFFVQAMPGGVSNIIMNSKMDFMMRVVDPAFDPAILLVKLKAAVVNQFLARPSLQLFFIPVNGLVVLAFWLVLRGEKERRRLALFSIGLVALHVLVGVLHQVQFRYLLMMWPPLVALGAVWAGPWVKRHQRPAQIIVALVVVGCLGLGGAGAAKSRRDGGAAATSRRDVRRIVASSLTAHDVVMVCTHKRSIEMAYALRPRSVVEFDPRQLSPTDLSGLFDRVQPARVLCPSTLFPPSNKWAAEAASLPRPYRDVQILKKVGHSVRTPNLDGDR